MIKLHDVIGMLGNTPLLMEPHAALVMFQTITNRMNSQQKPPEASEVETREPGFKVSGSTAVIPVHGIIDYRESIWSRWYGGSSCQALSSQLQMAIDDPEITKIVLDIDSPGGVISGVPELARQIYDQRSAKKMVAIANPMAASAAIWIGTACNELCVIGSGRVGSIGSFILHEEWTKYLAEVGISIQIFRNPTRKAERNVLEELTEEAASDIQSEVNEATRQFEAAVAKHRGVKSSVAHNDFGQGRMLSPKEAVSVGLIDRVSSLTAEVVEGRRGRKNRTYLADKIRSNKMKSATT